MTDTRPTLIPPRFVLPLLGLLVVLGAIQRLPGIGRSFGHDELFTISFFATRSFVDILSGYDLPNNHILHTLCVRVVQSLFGETEWLMRLPALLAGLAAIPALYWFARRLTGAPTVGLFAALLLAGHHLHISFSQAARGYTLLALLGILYAGLLWLGLTRVFTRQARQAHSQKAVEGIGAPDAETNNDTWIWVGVALTGSLATLTLPSATLLIGAGTIGALLMIRRLSTSTRRTALVPLILATLVIAVHTALIYLPLLQDLRSHAQRFGEPLSITGFSDFVSSVWFAIGPPRLGWLMHLLTAWGLITLEGARRGAGLFLGSLLGLPLLLNLALGTQADPRVYVFLVPFSLLAIAAGTESLRLLLQRKFSGTLRWAAAIPIVAVIAGFYTDIKAPMETGYRAAGRYVAEQTQAGDLVIVPYIMDSAIGYYSDGATVDRVRSLPKAGIKRVFFVDRPGTPRFRLADLMLASNFTNDAADHRDTYAHLQLPEAAFLPVREFGPTAVHQLPTVPTSFDHADLAQTDAWNLYYASNPDQTSFVTTTPLSFRLDPAGGSAVLHSRLALSFGANGLALIAVNLHGNGYASLYELVDGEPVAVQMVTPIAAPAMHVVGTDTFYAEVALAPVVADRAYGLFLTAHDVVDAGDWRLSFLPYTEPVQ